MGTVVWPAVHSCGWYAEHVVSETQRVRHACSAPAEYEVVSRCYPPGAVQEFLVCAAHAAAVRTDTDVLTWMASIRTLRR